MRFVSYAQNFEDIILWRALQHLPNGFYIDVGANDPVVDSISLAFYQRGWSGINIEPSAESFNRLSSQRTRDINLPIALAEVEGELTFYDVATNGWSTLEAQVANVHQTAGHLVSSRSIQVRTLNKICEEYVSGPIHFLKIDVEGAEGRVLQGIDLTVWRPWIIIIESTIPNTKIPSHSDWEPSVLSCNYEFIYFDGLNRYYLAAEHQDLKSILQTPPNVLDDFMLTSGHFFSAPVDDTALRHAEEQARHAEEQARHAEEQARHAEEKARHAEAKAAVAEEKASHAEGKAEAAEAWGREVEAWAITAEQQWNKNARDAGERALLAEANHNAVLRSISWRITKPLRYTKYKAKRSARRLLLIALSIVRSHPRTMRLIKKTIRHSPKLYDRLNLFASHNSPPS